MSPQVHQQQQVAQSSNKSQPPSSQDSNIILHKNKTNPPHIINEIRIF